MPGLLGGYAETDEEREAMAYRDYIVSQSETAASDLKEAHDRIEALAVKLKALRLTARILLQNAEGCAVNHYGEDFHLHGEPGWLKDCRSSIEEAEALLADMHSTPPSAPSDVQAHHHGDKPPPSDPQ